MKVNHSTERVYVFIEKDVDCTRNSLTKLCLPQGVVTSLKLKKARYYHSGLFGAGEMTVTEKIDRIFCIKDIFYILFGNKYTAL